MENKPISASDAKEISASIIPNAEHTLNQIFGEIKLRSGLGQTSFVWPVHRSILDQVLESLGELDYKVKPTMANDTKDYIIEISW